VLGRNKKGVDVSVCDEEFIGEAHGRMEDGEGKRSLYGNIIYGKEFGLSFVA
jgi:hypothetical protein